MRYCGLAGECSSLPHIREFGQERAGIFFPALFLFIVTLYGKFIDMPDFLTNPVGILAYLRIDQFSIYLCGEDGLMPQHFLKGFQRHPLEDGQNGECVAPDMRGDFNPAATLPAYDSKAEQHGVVFAYRKDTFGGVFLFIRTPVFFDQFDGNGQ